MLKGIMRGTRKLKVEETLSFPALFSQVITTSAGIFKTLALYALERHKTPSGCLFKQTMSFMFFGACIFAEISSRVLNKKLFLKRCCHSTKEHVFISVIFGVCKPVKARLCECSGLL